jgi:transposase/5S rRNA maturation endonuclease (ribonuclease M5)
MNVLKPNLQITIKTLLTKDLSQREINRKTGIDRKTIRRYGRLYDLLPAQESEDSKSPTSKEVATGSGESTGQNPPPRPPGPEPKVPKRARSACEGHRDWIEQQVRLGRNAMAIYQDLVERFAFTHHYNSVKRFVRRLRKQDPQQYDRLEFLPGEEAQVDYGQGALTLKNGKYRRPRLFIMTLKYSGRAFRKTVWNSSKETWARLHEEAFRYFRGCTQYVTLDNLKEGVIKPDIYEPSMNPLYAVMLQHYDVVADPARVKDANRKGTVENAVKYTQDTALKGLKFASLQEQNERLMHWEKQWAGQRIHGRAKRQVEAMYQEEKPYLKPLPLVPFRYFKQEIRTVNDDGTVQIDKSYYAANPAPLNIEVPVRIYDDQIEILDPISTEVIRRHARSKYAGSLIMKPEDRIFNPSRETDRLLARAERIGPYSFHLCEKWFNEEGRSGQRRMYGLTNLVRHYPASYVEQAAEVALNNDLKSFKALRRIVESFAAEEKTRKLEESESITQNHPLIRSGDDYAAFWNQHAAGAGSPPEPAANVAVSSTRIVEQPQLRQIWQQASWPKVIEVFQLSLDAGRRRRDDELWIKSPFTGEQQASLHVSLSANVYKDFSSGKGGGIMQFCREMLRLENREMTMQEVGQWMVAKGISMVNPQVVSAGDQQQPAKQTSHPISVNRAIDIDLRPYLRSDHPEWQRRGISAITCRYLGCGYLPPRTNGKADSPLNSRLVFQIRSVRESGQNLEPIILSHSGRALSGQQQERDGKYWSYPFRKGLEIYNQDHLRLDPQARRQCRESGLILVEGFFDAAKLVEAGCRNVGALMGSHISAEQIERLTGIHSRLRFPRIVLFLDRDQPGRDGAQRALERLRGHGFEISIFDWERDPEALPDSIQDPADMTVEGLRRLRNDGVL